MKLITASDRLDDVAQHICTTYSAAFLINAIDTHSSGVYRITKHGNALDARWFLRVTISAHNHVLIVLYFPEGASERVDALYYLFRDMGINLIYHKDPGA